MRIYNFIKNKTFQTKTCNFSSQKRSAEYRSLENENVFIRRRHTRGERYSFLFTSVIDVYEETRCKGEHPQERCKRAKVPRADRSSRVDYLSIAR